MVMVDKEKMSKSSVTLSPSATFCPLRLPKTCVHSMSGHTATSSIHSEDNLKQARASLWSVRIPHCGDLSAAPAAGGEGAGGPPSKEAMDDDFNTPEAYSALFDLVRDVPPEGRGHGRGRRPRTSAGAGATVLMASCNRSDAFLKGIEADEEVAEIVKRLIAERNRPAPTRTGPRRMPPVTTSRWA